ncbi:hypothetical protein HDU80_004102 [Chytriomyces hyalinus]|nr:hypothetical protein HDU80_004102 [Chytriomyces hyalinus]
MDESSSNRLPPEMLDAIMPFVSGRDLMRLGQCVRHYRSAASTLFNVGSGLRPTNTPSNLWPSTAINRPVQNLSKMQALLRLQHRHGATLAVALCSLEPLRDLVSIIPTSMPVHFTFTCSYAEDHLMLGILADANLRISCLDFADSSNYTEDDSEANMDQICHQLKRLVQVTKISTLTPLPEEMWAMLPQIQGLQCLEYGSLHSFPLQALAAMPHLRHVYFSCENACKSLEFDVAWWTELVQLLPKLSLQKVSFGRPLLVELGTEYLDFMQRCGTSVEKAGWLYCLDGERGGVTWQRV